MDMNNWGVPIFRPKYVGKEERGDTVVFKFSRPSTNISGIKTYMGKGYTVGFVSWFHNLYVEYIVIDSKIHQNIPNFIKYRLNELLSDARKKGWNKRYIAEAEALGKLLESM